MEKQNKNHTVGTVPKSKNRNIGQIHDPSFSWVGTGTFNEVKLI